MSNPFDIFNDDFDAPAPAGAPMPSVAKAQAGEGFVEQCPKCRGSGRFIGWGGRNVGQCFACKGVGKSVYKTSAATRAKERDNAARSKAQSIEAFKVEHPAVWAWLLESERKHGTPQAFQFAISLYDALHKYGSLTDNQLEAAQRCVAQREEKRAARAVAAPVVDSAGVDRLKAAFDTAIAYTAANGLKLSPRITVDGITIAPAKATSANPGALYVKAGGEYLGKIVGAKFFPTAACTTDHEAKLALFLTNPAEAAKVYGQTTGTCCICNATLISKWKHRGIGPICAEKFGWA